MKYFLAIEVPYAPYVRWNGIGDYATTTAFEQSEWNGNPLVKPENEILAYQYGVYPQHIVAGVLVDFTAPEITAFRDAYNIKIGLQADSLRIKDINNDSFTYDSENFPMDEVSRLFYMCIEKTTPLSSKLRTMANTAYNLANTDIPAFMTAYYAELLLISKHTV